MTVCQFFLRGQCKFGNSCRFEHPGVPTQANGTGGSFGNQTWGNKNTGTTGNPIGIAFTLEGLTRDMTPMQDKPIWPLSTFGAAKGEPTLFTGLDESPEELRWKAVQALKTGNISEYEKYEAEKTQSANAVWDSALKNIKKVYDKAHEMTVAAHRGVPIPAPFGPQPISQSISQGNSAFGAVTGTAASTSAFGGAAIAPTSAFGKSAFGQSAFGQPAFGQSAFGQTAQKPVSAFGQSQPTASTTAFGQVAAPPATSAFGQAASSTPSAFAAQPAATSTFGQSSQPSSFIKPGSGFGAFGGSNNSVASAPASGAFSAFAGKGTSAFGAGAATSSTPTFGQSAFGNAANAAAPATSAFGNAATQSTSAFGSSNPPVSAFGAAATPSAPVSAFGQPKPAPPAFSAFTSTGGAPSAFGQAAQQQSVSAFGQPQGQPQSQATSAFGAPAFGVNAFGASLPSKPKVIGPPDFQAALPSYKAQPGKDRYDGLLPPNYLESLPSSAREAFSLSKFEWGKIPDWIPPIEMR